MDSPINGGGWYEGTDLSKLTTEDVDACDYVDDRDWPKERDADAYAMRVHDAKEALGEVLAAHGITALLDALSDIAEDLAKTDQMVLHRVDNIWANVALVLHGLTYMTKRLAGIDLSGRAEPYKVEVK